VKRATEESRGTGAGQTLEYGIRHKNGTWRVLESTASVIRNAKGAPEKFVIVNRDITERKSAQEALRLADADFKSVVEDAPYGIYRANGDGQLFRVNPALQKMLGHASSTELLKANLQLDVFKFPLEFHRFKSNRGFQRGGSGMEAQGWHADHGAMQRASHRSYPRIKVLYISGYTDSFIAGHGVLGPESNLLNKPFTEEALIHKVRDVLDSAKRGQRINEMVLAGAPKQQRTN